MTSPKNDLNQQLALVFAPLDKRALGIALGSVVAVLVLLLTFASMVLDPGGRFPLTLLDEYFTGYDVSLTGALIGAAWGFVVGFMWGWFLAFSRNLVLAIWLLAVSVRANLSSSRTFLDHI